MYELIPMSASSLKKKSEQTLSSSGEIKLYITVIYFENYFLQGVCFSTKKQHIFQYTFLIFDWENKKNISFEDM